MEIIDLQLHEPAPFEDWAAADVETRRRVLTEALWQSMDAVGVNAVALNPLEDQTWMLDLAARFPDRVAAVPMFGEDTADVEARVADLYARPGVLAIRFGALKTPVTFVGDHGLTVGPESLDQFIAGRHDAAFAACEKQGVPIWVEIQGAAYAIERVARKFPELQIIIDHMGINQPPAQPRDVPPWKDLPTVL